MRQTIINIAQNEVGTIGGKKYCDWFGFDGEWCGIFCSWCYWSSGLSLGVADFWKGFASVPFAVKHWASNKTEFPLPGDLVIFDWNKDGEADHVGLFHSWLDRSAGLFYTIEGNTHPANDSNGNQVMKRQRNMACVICFLNPKNLGPDPVNT